MQRRAVAVAIIPQERMAGKPSGPFVHALAPRAGSHRLGSPVDRATLSAVVGIPLGNRMQNKDHCAVMTVREQTMAAATKKPANLRQLRESGWTSKPVKREIYDNFLRRGPPRGAVSRHHRL